jgi:isopentenyl-diphosphate delta-isomerase
MMESIIAVDTNDQPQQAVEKYTAHRFPGTLHRAVTIILINEKGEWLLTQRSAQKPLWPLYWDWACSTHQWWPHEPTIATCQRRLPFELGIDIKQVRDLHHLGTYEYHAVYSPEWAENEINHLWLGQYDGELQLNPDEVKDYRWALPKEWLTELSQPGHSFVPWIESGRSITADLIK